MKVGIIGNMNNNHFSLMRYLRELGIDAYLLLYANDGVGSRSHFVPENDTWELEKWAPYIIPTDLVNGHDKFFTHVLFPGYIKKLLQSFDLIIGNGLAPAYSFIAKKELFFFIPYSFGGEFLTDNIHLNFKQRIKYALFTFFQVKGLKNYVKYVVTMDSTESNCANFSRLGSSIMPLGIPMVYNREPIRIDKSMLRTEIRDIITIMKQSDYVVFSHVSHNYMNLENEYFDIKKNKVLIEGFARFLKHSHCKCARLFLLNYGKDVEESKKFIQTLGITDSVVWLPTMARKEIMLLLDHVNVGGGEFGGVVWGGTGYEFMAKGVPFLQYVDIAPDIFQQTTGCPLPPIFNVSTPEQIKEVLLQYERNPELLKVKGNEMSDWFDRYNGIGLAQQYVDLFTQHLEQ